MLRSNWFGAQDMRLWTFNNEEEAVECNNEKLVSGSTTAYMRSARDFLRLTVFQNGQPWPTVIATGLFLRDDNSSNAPIEVNNNKRLYIHCQT